MLTIDRIRVRDRMHAAGRDAFNAGKPCVPGLDALWTRELGTSAAWAKETARWWRYGWNAQAAVVERVRPARPCEEMAFDGFTFTSCGLLSTHQGECR